MAIVGIVCDTIIMGYYILFNILHISIRIAVIKPNIIPQTSPQKASVSVVPVCPKSSKKSVFKALTTYIGDGNIYSGIIPETETTCHIIKKTINVHKDILFLMMFCNFLFNS